MRIISIILLISLLLFSCNNTKDNKDRSDFYFYLPEEDLHITTSKREGGDFYVMFSKIQKVEELSDSVDYIHCQVEDYTFAIILDPIHKNDISFTYPYVKKIQKRELNITEMESDEFNSTYYREGYRTAPDTLKSPYKALYIIPTSYHIILQRDSIFDSQVILKKGNIFGR